MTANTACTCTSRDDQALLEYMAPLQAELSNGFSYEVNEDGECRDEDGYPTSPVMSSDFLDTESRMFLDGMSSGFLDVCGGGTVSYTHLTLPTSDLV